MPLPASVLPLIVRLSPYILGGLDYLRRELLPSAPVSAPVGEPYTPPFGGGQCNVAYWVQVAAGIENGAIVYQWTTGTAAFNRDQLSPSPTTPVQGGVKGLTYTTQSNGWNCIAQGGSSSVSFFVPNFGQTSSFPPRIEQVRRQDGGVDNCGDLSNPNPPPPVGSDGIASSPVPNVEGEGLKVVQGIAIPPVPNFAAALAAALAAARAATDALSAIKAIADAIDALTNLLNKLKDALDNKDKDEDDKAKSVFRYNFGSLSKDGFRRLYPDENTSKLMCSYIDLQILSIPVGYGKYFGSLSPNFYRFKSLGYISFVTPTFGVMEVREIEFARVSMEVPENAFGFFYHLGLDGAIFANASGFYVKEERGN